MSAYKVSPPDPPEARHWVTLPADFLLAMVRFSEQHERKPKGSR